MDHLLRCWGENLRAERLARGLKQSELAQRAGVGQAAVSKVELAQRWPSDDTKFRLAAALGVPVGDLFPYPDDVPALAAS